MDTKQLEAIQNHPEFQQLIKARSRLAWTLSIIMLVAYYAFILMIAFDPAALGVPLSAGSVTTIGIPVGVGIILLAFGLTGWYVRKANSDFDAMTNEIKQSVRSQG